MHHISPLPAPPVSNVLSASQESIPSDMPSMGWKRIVTGPAIDRHFLYLHRHLLTSGSGVRLTEGCGSTQTRPQCLDFPYECGGTQIRIHREAENSSMRGRRIYPIWPASIRTTPYWMHACRMETIPWRSHALHMAPNTLYAGPCMGQASHFGHEEDLRQGLKAQLLHSLTCIPFPARRRSWSPSARSND
jgi:hypothetical protein